MAKKNSESSPHVVRYTSSELSTRPLSENDKQLLQRLAKMTDEDVDFSDIPPLDYPLGEWEIGKFYRPIKRQVSIRLDSDVLAWCRTQHPKYQTYINEVLRREMMAGLK